MIHIRRNQVALPVYVTSGHYKTQIFTTESSPPCAQCGSTAHRDCIQSIHGKGVHRSPVNTPLNNTVQPLFTSDGFRKLEKARSKSDLLKVKTTKDRF